MTSNITIYLCRLPASSRPPTTVTAPNTGSHGGRWALSVTVWSKNKPVPNLFFTSISLLHSWLLGGFLVPTTEVAEMVCTEENKSIII